MIKGEDEKLEEGERIVSGVELLVTTIIYVGIFMLVLNILNFIFG